MLFATSTLGWFTYGVIAFVIWIAIAFWPAESQDARVTAFSATSYSACCSSPLR